MVSLVLREVIQTHDTAAERVVDSVGKSFVSEEILKAINGVCQHLSRIVNRTVCLYDIPGFVVRKHPLAVFCLCNRIVGAHPFVDESDVVLKNPALIRIAKGPDKSPAVPDIRTSHGFFGRNEHLVRRESVPVNLCPRANARVCAVKNWLSTVTNHEVVYHSTSGFSVSSKGGPHVRRIFLCCHARPRIRLRYIAVEPICRNASVKKRIEHGTVIVFWRHTV